MGESTKLKVLVVDDEVVLNEVLAKILDMYGFEVEVSDSAQGAWDKLSGKDFDIIVSDVRMPSESGIDLVKKIKASKKFSFPIILLTGSLNVGVEEVYEIGVDLLLRKPISLQRLPTEINRLIKLKNEMNTCEAIATEDISGIVKVRGDDFEIEVDFKAEMLGKYGMFVRLSDEFMPIPKEILEIEMNLKIKEESHVVKFSTEVMWTRTAGYDGNERGIGLKVIAVEKPSKSVLFGVFNGLDEISLIPISD